MPDDKTKPTDQPVTDSESTSATDASPAVPASVETHQSTAVPSVESPAQASHDETAKNPEVHAVNSSLTLVLQWLTYAFWLWFSFGMAWLTGVTIGYMMYSDSGSEDVAQLIAYPIAAVIVLVIIALTVDVFYTKQEPHKKTGAASVIMIIHAVLFALFGIGTLIITVFSLVNMALTSGVGSGSDGATVTLYTGLIMVLIYVLLLVRTIIPEKIPRLRQIIWGILVAIAIIMMTIGLVGPVARAIQTKQDRLIESTLPILARSINNYAIENDKLPENLSEVLDVTATYRDESAKDLVDADLVRYKANTKTDTMQTDTTNIEDMYKLNSSTSQRTIYYYQLCVTYDHEKKTSSTYSYSSSYKSKTTPNTAKHSSGETCYDLQTSEF